MKCFLVYRHGSNAANQPMTPSAAVAIINATDEVEARKVATENINCYANQFLSFVDEEELTDEQVDDWNDVNQRDAELRAVGEDSIIF
jgi:hypothetical protein